MTQQQSAPRDTSAYNGMTNYEIRPSSPEQLRGAGLFAAERLCVDAPDTPISRDDLSEVLMALGLKTYKQAS